MSAGGDTLDTAHGAISWLLKLRWASVVGQAATILVVDRGMGIELPLLPLLVVVGLAAASNLACSFLLPRRTVPEWFTGGLIALDVLLLTALLYFTGGPFNPFSFLYLVQIALGALVLRPRWMWPIVGLAVVCFGLLFVDYVPLAAVGSPDPKAAAASHGGHAAHQSHAAHQNHTAHQHHAAHGSHSAPAAHAAHGEHDMMLHVYGMWVAFGVAACFIVYFLHRVARALADREAELAAMRDQKIHSEKLASLATLSAGAAHELSTPLATIAVVAKELERSLENREGHCAEDARLIREQVDRCRSILNQMAADAGESAGEALANVRVNELVAEAIQGLPEGADRVNLETESEGTLRVPRRALAQALRGVIKNALEASPDDAPVLVSARDYPGGYEIAVEDEGSGMPEDVRARAGEPFFSTKEPGRGMGLGLFLTRAIVERLGGRVDLRSEEGRGTRVALTLPPMQDDAAQPGALA